MKYNPKIHHRRSIRLPGYDYSRAGAYFITICTQNRVHLFGEIMDGKMILNDAGKIVGKQWQWLESQYGHVILDAFVVMPNHLHGIIVISDVDTRRGGSRTAPTTSRTAPTIKPLGRLVGAFKTTSTKQINNMRNTPGEKLWQRNYWEHIIRNENEYRRIAEYIRNNPAKWEMDKLNNGAGNQVMEPQAIYNEEVWMV